MTYLSSAVRWTIPPFVRFRIWERKIRSLNFIVSYTITGERVFPYRSQDDWLCHSIPDWIKQAQVKKKDIISIVFRCMCSLFFYLMCSMMQLIKPPLLRVEIRLRSVSKPFTMICMNACVAIVVARLCSCLEESSGRQGYDMYIWQKRERVRGEEEEEGCIYVYGLLRCLFVGTLLFRAKIIETRY